MTKIVEVCLFTKVAVQTQGFERWFSRQLSYLKDQSVSPVSYPFCFQFNTDFVKCTIIGNSKIIFFPTKTYNLKHALIIFLFIFLSSLFTPVVAILNVIRGWNIFNHHISFIFDFFSLVDWKLRNKTNFKYTHSSHFLYIWLMQSTAFLEFSEFLKRAIIIPQIKHIVIIVVISLDITARVSLDSLTRWMCTKIPKSQNKKCKA